MPRPYTGFDRVAGGRRAGTERFVQLMCRHFPAIWNNGTWVVRTMRGKTSMSVHATGRAVDFSWRGRPYKGSGQYDDARDAFIAPQPFPSWQLDETTCQWQSPIPYPDDGEMYVWDEPTLQWVAVP